MGDLAVTGSALMASTRVKPEGETPTGATRAPLPSPLRWSSARDCARKAVLETGPADRELYDREQRILWRGRDVGETYGRWLKAKFGANAVWREVKVPWEFGIGHMDIFLRPTRTAIEVLSSARASDSMLHSKRVQLALYMDRYKSARNGCLVVLDPADLSEERWMIGKDTSVYRELLEEVEERIASLRRWRETGELPDRVCSKPSDAQGHFCRHADTCFAGWEPDPLPAVDRPEVVQAADRVATLKFAEAQLKGAYAEAKQVRMGAQLELAALLEGQPREVLAGPFRIKRTDVNPKPKLDWKRAEGAGALNLELLAEFMEPSTPYTKWAVERHEGAPGDVDYGEEPF